MIRSLALVSALAAASLSASALSAQSTAPPAPKPAAAPAIKHVSAVQDAGTKVRVAATQPPAAKPAAANSQAPAARHATWTKDQIQEAQEGLARMGLYHGKATGMLNKATSKALRAYQKRNQLPVTGKLSDDVLAKLKSA